MLLESCTPGGARYPREAVIPALIAPALGRADVRSGASTSVDALEHRRGAEAPRCAEAEQGGALARAGKLVGHRGDHPGAGGAEGVTEGERSAVHVELLRIDLPEGGLRAQ